jgi:ribonuclease BN (tRNA processing enzyme)
VDRRDLIRAGALALLARPLCALAGPTGRSRLTLLGTAGGPRPRTHRSAPAQVIVVDDAAYVIDCGDGVARQLVLAGVPLRTVRQIFITHHHSDHTADYGNLCWLAWTSGLASRVESWGPPPLSRMTRQFLEMNAEEIALRMADEGRPALAPLIVPHDVSAPGLLLDDGRVRVTAALVDHPPVVPAFAYRFDTPDRSIVISGDTRRSDSLIALARGADILVHEAMFPSAVDRLVAGVPNAPGLAESIRRHHTSAEDAGRVAQAAGVKHLVLSHLIPAEDPEVTEQMWLEAAARHFSGRLTVGRDLLEL